MMAASHSTGSTHSDAVFATVFTFQVEEIEIEAHREVRWGDDCGETQLVVGVRGREPRTGQSP